MKLSITFVSDRGKRLNNEDALLIGDELFQPENMKAPIIREIEFSPHEHPFVAAVADGMGGHNKGEVASRMVLETLNKRLMELSSADQIHDVVNRAHDNIVQYGLADPTAYGLGSTVAGLMVYGDDDTAFGLAFNVGDSRVYRRSGSFLQQLSVDQTVGQQLLESGLIKENEILLHPHVKNLTESIGGIMVSAKSIEVKMKQVRLKSEDLFLICSDGLTDVVNIDLLEAIVEKCASDKDTILELYQQAIAAGGQDNISIVILRFWL